MDVEHFAEWLRRQSHHVVRTESSYWYNQGPRVYQAFPFHSCIQPSEKEIRGFLVKEKAIALRYSTRLESIEGKISYHVVFGDNLYDLESLGSNARSKIRRGLKRCQVERISVRQLADEGWALLENTLKRQGRVGGMKQEEWTQLCLAAEDLPGFEAWGAFVEGVLSASVLSACIGDVCYLLYPQSHEKYFNHYVNNALIYTISHEMTSRTDIRQIFYGTQALDAPSSMDDFKLRMGYCVKPVRQRVVFHPMLKIFVGRTSTLWMSRVLRRYPNHATLRKIDGMLQFYTDGKRPADKQHWPECLGKQRQELLEHLSTAVN